MDPFMVASDVVGGSRLQLQRSRREACQLVDEATPLLLPRLWGWSFGPLAFGEFCFNISSSSSVPGVYFCCGWCWTTWLTQDVSIIHWHQLSTCRQLWGGSVLFELSEQDSMQKPLGFVSCLHLFFNIKRFSQSSPAILNNSLLTHLSYITPAAV